MVSRQGVLGEGSLVLPGALQRRAIGRGQPTLGACVAPCHGDAAGYGRTASPGSKRSSPEVVGIF